MRSYWVRMGPKDWCPQKKKFRHKDTKEDGYAKMEAETGVTMLQAKECQGLLVTTRRQEERKDPLLAWRENVALSFIMRKGCPWKSQILPKVQKRVGLISIHCCRVTSADKQTHKQRTNGCHWDLRVVCHLALLH